MPPTRAGRQLARRPRAPLAAEVIEISDDEEDVRPAKSTCRHSRSRKPIFIDLSELSDDDDTNSPLVLVRNRQDDASEIDDGAPFPEAKIELPPPPTYEQVLSEVEPGMRASGAPEWAVQMAARLMYSAEYKLDYETLLELEKVVETSSNVTHFMSTVNRTRGNGEKTHYDLCPFRNGMYPCNEPYNLRSIFTARDLDHLTMRDLRWYILGYLGSNYAVPETRRERVNLLKAIIGILV
ncbi:hypothetical protein EV121DRAFT_286614 [Schizophyllum commune]